MALVAAEPGFDYPPCVAGLMLEAGEGRRRYRTYRNRPQVHNLNHFSLMTSCFFLLWGSPALIIRRSRTLWAQQTPETFTLFLYWDSLRSRGSRKLSRLTQESSMAHFRGIHLQRGPEAFPGSWPEG